MNRPDDRSTRTDTRTVAARITVRRSTVADAEGFARMLSNPEVYPQLLQKMVEKGTRLLPEAASTAAFLAKKEFSRVGDVSIQLKKVDQKKNKFTIAITSDDITVEKKDRNVAEPIQFYSGRDHMLFELVIWTVQKDKASGTDIPMLNNSKNRPRLRVQSLSKSWPLLQRTRLPIGIPLLGRYR